MSDDDYEKKVFINCPFDEKYDPIFLAIAFTIQDCGFLPDCMKCPSSGIRLYNIIKKMEESKFAIHDLSRQDLDKPPRFNMPFELGLFIGILHYKDKNKKFLILDSKKYRYQKVISDILGIDPEYHKNEPRIAVNKVRNWLITYEPKKKINLDPKIWERYQEFRKKLPKLCRDSGTTFRNFMKDFTIIDYSNYITAWLIEQENFELGLHDYVHIKNSVSYKLIKGK